MMERGLPVGDSLFYWIFFESIVHCTLYENLHEKYVCRPNLQANKNIHTNPNLYENEDKKI